MRLVGAAAEAGMEGSPPELAAGEVVSMAAMEPAVIHAEVPVVLNAAVAVVGSGGGESGGDVAEVTIFFAGGGCLDSSAF